MKQSVLKHRKRWCMWLAIYQMLGSIITFLLIFIFVHTINAGVILALIPITGFCLVSLFAGIFFFFKNNEQRFFTLSKLNFCIQLIQLSVPGFALGFYYGPYLAIGFDGDGTFLFRFQTLTSNFICQFGATEERYFFLNLIPLLPLIVLRWIERNPVVEKVYEDAFMEEA